VNTVILAGGRGTRLIEETTIKPKPMVEIGGVPILVHIIRLYAHYGFREFTLALGYKGDVVKEYFLNYRQRNSDLTVHVKTGQVEYARVPEDDWVIQMLDTGEDTLTGGRLRRLRALLRETFMVTYGDGVADLDIRSLLDFHRSHGRLATVTAVRPPGRFGVMALDKHQVTSFKEKPQTEEGWINGGFFVFEPGVFDYLADDTTVLENEPLEQLAANRQLMAYRHEGFWYAMDNVRDRDVLNGLWRQDAAPWRRPSKHV
jgi:glucose-1-phosphate cytidylyltransferase